jgi:hypothetical protein
VNWQVTRRGPRTPSSCSRSGYAACFESALGVVARRQKAEADDVEIDSKVMLLPTEERGFQPAVAGRHAAVDRGRGLDAAVTSIVATRSIPQRGGVPYFRFSSEGPAVN